MYFHSCGVNDWKCDYFIKKGETISLVLYFKCFFLYILTIPMWVLYSVIQTQYIHSCRLAGKEQEQRHLRVSQAAVWGQGGLLCTAAIISSSQAKSLKGTKSTRGVNTQKYHFLPTKTPPVRQTARLAAHSQPACFDGWLLLFRLSGRGGRVWA